MENTPTNPVKDNDYLPQQESIDMPDNVSHPLPVLVHAESSSLGAENLVEVSEMPCIKKHIDYGHDCNPNESDGSQNDIFCTTTQDIDVSCLNVSDEFEELANEAMAEPVNDPVPVHPTKTSVRETANVRDAENEAANTASAVNTTQSSEIGMDISVAEVNSDSDTNINKTIQMEEDMDESLSEIPATQHIADTSDYIPETQQNESNVDASMNGSVQCDITVVERARDATSDVSMDTTLNDSGCGASSQATDTRKSSLGDSFMHVTDVSHQDVFAVPDASCIIAPNSAMILAMSQPNDAMNAPQAEAENEEAADLGKRNSYEICKYVWSF